MLKSPLKKADVEKLKVSSARENLFFFFAGYALSKSARALTDALNFFPSVLNYKRWSQFGNYRGFLWAYCRRD